MGITAALIDKASLAIKLLAGQFEQKDFRRNLGKRRLLRRESS